MGREEGKKSDLSRRTLRLKMQIRRKLFPPGNKRNESHCENGLKGFDCNTSDEIFAFIIL